MTNAALRGKPYAGNPHVRFDEGEVASAATPRRGSLLYTEEEAKDAKHQEYVDKEKQRRSRIKEFCKIAGGAVVAIVAYALGKKSNSDKA